MNIHHLYQEVYHRARTAVDMMQHLQIYIQYGVEILKDGLKTSEGSEIHIQMNLE